MVSGKLIYVPTPKESAMYLSGPCGKSCFLVYLILPKIEFTCGHILHWYFRPVPGPRGGPIFDALMGWGTTSSDDEGLCPWLIDNELPRLRPARLWLLMPPPPFGELLLEDAPLNTPVVAP